MIFYFTIYILLSENIISYHVLRLNGQQLHYAEDCHCNIQGDLPISWRFDGLHFLPCHQDGADHVQVCHQQFAALPDLRKISRIINCCFYRHHCSVGYSDELAGLACTIVILVGAAGTVLFGVLAQVCFGLLELYNL